MLAMGRVRVESDKNSDHPLGPKSTYTGLLTVPLGAPAHPGDWVGVAQSSRIQAENGHPRPLQKPLRGGKGGGQGGQLDICKHNFEAPPMMKGPGHPGPTKKTLREGAGGGGARRPGKGPLIKGWGCLLCGLRPHKRHPPLLMRGPLPGRPGPVIIGGGGALTGPTKHCRVTVINL
jgi:hypothetical protein